MVGARGEVALQILTPIPAAAPRGFLCFGDVCLTYKLTQDFASPQLRQCVLFCRNKETRGRN